MTRYTFAADFLTVRFGLQSRPPRGLRFPVKAYLNYCGTSFPHIPRGGSKAEPSTPESPLQRYLSGRFNGTLGLLVRFKNDVAGNPDFKCLHLLGLEDC